MMKKFLRRTVSLLLVFSLTLSIPVTSASASLQDAVIQDYLDLDSADLQNGEPGISGGTFSLNVDPSDYETDPDDEPIDFSKTLYNDLTFDYEGHVGNGPGFAGTGVLPFLTDKYLEEGLAKFTGNLHGQNKVITNKYLKELFDAQGKLKDSEKAFKEADSYFRSLKNRPKNLHYPVKYKGGLKAEIGRAANARAPLQKQYLADKAHVESIEKGYNKAISGNNAKVVGKNTRVQLKKGALSALTALVSMYGLYKMWDQPEVGYKSPFLETLATYFRAGSNWLGFMSAFYPPMAVAALIHGLGEMILTSETAIALGNKYMSDLGFLDDWANIKNEFDIITLTPLAEWRAGVKGAQEAEQEQNIRKNAHKGAHVTSAAIGGMLPPGIFDIVRGATATANGINVYKPNIYIYPEDITEVSVSFSHPTALTVTDPVYPRDGWNVTAYPDGSLRSGEDEYSFLFYEAETAPRYYQTEEGFVIPADNREAVFTSILEQYGLNGQEIADFNDFWCEKLDEDCDYAMYPQLTDTVDEAMPMTVSPAPDSVLRLWFAFVKNDTPEKEAEPEFFQRDGSVVIEWGGLFLRNKAA